MPDEAGEALRWIVGLLGRLEIPFQVVGGLAAIAHGATRPLVDIDLYVPDERALARIAEAAPREIVRRPEAHRDEDWDLTFLALQRGGWKIEVAAAATARVRDRRAGTWVGAAIEFGASEVREVAGVPVPVMPKDRLIDYKEGLGREVDRLDLDELRGASGS